MSKKDEICGGLKPIVIPRIKETKKTTPKKTTPKKK